MVDREDVPRLSVVIERQRRELARVGAERDATMVVAMATGVLMERHGWSPAQAARQLADLAAAAGLPEPEMAAAVLAQEPPSAVSADAAPSDPANPATAADTQARVVTSNTLRLVGHHTSATPSRTPARSRSPSTARAASLPHGAAAGT